MANRHSHKKLRAEVRARMHATGESYQRARERIVAFGTVRAELTATMHFGQTRTIATIELHGLAINVLVPRWEVGDHAVSALRAWLPHGVH